MRQTFFKLLPGLVGGLLGWMMFNPPVWLEALGPLAWVVNLGLVAVLLVSVVGFIIVNNLPERLETEIAPETDVHEELRDLERRFAALGFRSAGPPLRVKIAPSAILLGFVHEKEPVYASAFRTETSPPKTSYDFVSILHGERGGLTTNADPGGAALPAGDGGLRQLFPGESVDAMFARHLDGIAYLNERGIPCRALSAGMFAQDLALGISKQRAAFMAAPFVGTLVTLWRAASKQVPFVGSLREQTIAENQISRLLTT